MAIEYPIHPAANLLPMMSESELAALADDIKVNGQREDIVLLNGAILDGRNRIKACEIAKVTPRFCPADPAAVRDPYSYVYSKSVHRNLTDSQKACAAVCFAESIAGMSESQYTALRRLCEGGTSSTKTRDLFGHLFGVSGRYMQDAKLLREKARDLFDEVFAGVQPITRAKSAYRRRVKSASALGASVPDASVPSSVTIITADCQANEIDHIALVIADPTVPSSDSSDDLSAFVDRWVAFCDMAYRSLAPTGSLVAFARDEFVAEMAIAIKDAGLTIINWIAWDGGMANTPGRFTRSKAHIIYAVTDPNHRTFHTEAITVPTARATKYADRRVRTADHSVTSGKTMSDIWLDIPRLTRSSAEAIPGQPNQLPEALIHRLVATLSNPGDLILDPFCGSGTVPAVCQKLGRACLAYEIDPARADVARRRCGFLGTPVSGSAPEHSDPAPSRRSTGILPVPSVAESPPCVSAPLREPNIESAESAESVDLRSVA